MERRDNYEKALREEEEALRASMPKNRQTPMAGETLQQDSTIPKQTPIAPRWARAKREADKKKKPR